MKLPNDHLATVDRRKVVEYLLNPAHPDNGGKARFFATLGFSLDTVELLIGALRSIAAVTEVAAHVESVHGDKYVVDGLLPVHTGSGPGRMVRTVWAIDRRTSVPRLVTAYPHEE